MGKFYVGQTVTIVRDRVAHGFNIGEKVVITSLDEKGEPYTAKNINGRERCIDITEVTTNNKILIQFEVTPNQLAEAVKVMGEANRGYDVYHELDEALKKYLRANF